MASLDVLTTQEPDRWIQVLEHCAPYDFYHLPQYHALAEETGEGDAHLFVYGEGECTIALPLLLRSLDEEILQSVGALWRDATSVYGYAGPVCSHREVPDALIRNFQSALSEKLRELRVVSVFSRLNPFLSQNALLAGLGEYRVSRTVAIDLTLPPAEQRSKFRKRYKVAINRLRRLGLTCIHDQNGSHLREFMQIYYETMQRVEAAERYFFTPEYFERLWESLESRIHLFVCLFEGRAIAAGLFVACHGILQYHLGGTLNDAYELAPMKLLVDEVREWATGQGIRVFHLGGGLTPEDSLFHFKMGFSDRTQDFAAWRWTLIPDVYRALCVEKSRCDSRLGRQAADLDYFPEYRCPSVSCVALPAGAAAAEPLAEVSHGGPA